MSLLFLKPVEGIVWIGNHVIDGIFEKRINEHVRDVARTLNWSALVRASGSRKGDRRKADQGSVFIRRAPGDEAGG